jgi:hypothetical protein
MAFWNKKKKTPDPVRNERGQFVVTAPAAAPANPGYTPVKSAENEAKIVETGLGTLETGLKFIDTLDKVVDNRLQKLAPPVPVADSGPSSLETGLEILDAIMPYVGPYIGPYVPGILEKFGIKPNVGVAPIPPAGIEGGTPPSPPAPTPTENTKKDDFLTYITLAANTPPGAIRPFLGQFEAELAKRKIDINEFKRAVQNLNKAWKL